MMFEAEERGEYISWENLSFKLDDSQYWSYIDRYETRAFPLVQTALKSKLGPLNYWRRSNLLWKFDHWKEGWHKQKYLGAGNLKRSRKRDTAKLELRGNLSNI
jgi:hypothetical protein